MNSTVAPIVRLATAIRPMVLLLPLACAAPHSGFAAGLVPSDVFRFETVSDPAISPDGRDVVYVRNRADVDTDSRYSSLWIVDSSGSHHRPLTEGRRHDAAPRWSPDGSRLAYVGEVDGHAQILVRTMATGETAQITHLDQAPQGLSWSPDGRSLAFASLVPESPPKIAELPTPPTGAKWAEPAKAYDRLVYRFDGVGYLTPGHTELFVVAATGGAARQVTHCPAHCGGSPLQSAHIDWTPDGRFLITSINRNADPDVEFRDTDVYEVSVADGALRALTHRAGPDDNPMVSPDGTEIAYTGFDDRHQGYQVSHLYVMKRDGSASRMLATELDRDVTSPRWAADGSGIYFQYDDQGDTKVGFATRDGKTRIVAEHLATSLTSYSDGWYSLARNGAVAYTYGTPTVPSELAVSQRGTRTVLTANNAELLREKPPGAVEELWWTSPKGGVRIQGWLVKPPDFDPSRHYPLILEIHGGPFANYGARYDYSKQVWAAKGYLVLYANPRGSTSYGEAFGNLIHHAYPGDDFDDLNAGVDLVVQKGYADPRNLFVTGGSGGGVLTAWMIEHTERFAAAAVLYPVINWYSFALTTDIPFTTRYWFPDLPWKATSHYMDRSLSTRVEAIKTPAMVMTGEEDYRTPSSEAEQFYTELKLRHVDSVLVRVPGEPHGLERFPSHQLMTAQYIAGWFDKHKRP